MQRRFVQVVGPDLDDVADVDDQGVAPRLYEMPRAFAAHLESGLLVLQQDSQSAGVGMMVNTETAFLAAYRVVIQAQETRVGRAEIAAQEAGGHAQVD